MLRFCQFLCLLGLLMAAPPLRAASASFDLVGPRLTVIVKRGDLELPLEQVPNLNEGDRVSIRLDRSAAQTERYRLVSAFLSGAVDRPAKSWFQQAESWKKNGGTLAVVVPKGAQQMAVFVVPDSGGAVDAIISAVRKQPGAFVRALQGLNQASLDRARLDEFLRQMAEAEKDNPSGIVATSQVLTRSLAIRLKAECLQQPAEVQAACLTGDRETLLLADTHSSALADTLAGAPADLAFQLSATPQAGYGSYSSYIGVIRDVFRLFGAFQSTQLQFIPALLQVSSGHAAILLNSPVSFAKPISVMVAALPAIESPKPPPLRRADPDAALCALPGTTLPVEGAPLVYATQYVRNMRLRVLRTDGSPTDIPVRADPRRGGFVMEAALPAGEYDKLVEAGLHGDWGFAKFEGPVFDLSTPQANGWAANEQSSLVVGRANEVMLLGEGAGCVTQVGMRRGEGPVQPLSWKAAGPTGILVTLPLQKTAPGPVSIVIEGVAGMAPETLLLTASQEAASLDELVFHTGDDEAVMTGSRLDQVRNVTLGGLAFLPGALTRVDKQDRLTLVPGDVAAARLLPTGATVTADVGFANGRHKKLAVTIAPQRTGAVLLRVSARTLSQTLAQTPAQTPARDGTLPIVIQSDGVFAQDARLTFAFRIDGPPLTGLESIEVGTVDGRAAKMLTAGQGYDVQDGATGIVAFDPVSALGPVAYGGLRFRVVRGGSASSWTPLATVVRLPQIGKLKCTRGGGCVLSGDRLFLIKSIAANERFEPVQEIPDGFIMAQISTQGASDGRLFLRLRDAPEAVAMIRAP